MVVHDCVTSAVDSHESLEWVAAFCWSIMTELDDVQIHDNLLTGTLPPEWKGLRQLKLLYLYGNELSGALPGEWSEMSSLEELYLFQNRLTGSLPWEWVWLSKLRELGLGYNGLSGTLPSTWESLGSIQLLHLNKNDFSGSLPWEWSRMSSVTTLALGENRLEGTLPLEWEEMSSLQDLFLQRNQLSGTLPPEWSRFAALRRLYLHDNLLVGSLPEEWAGLTSVLELILNQNELTGTLPPQWSNMANLERLYLQENQLSGTLPAQWGRMQRMQGIELQRNNLVGTVPPEWPNGMRAIQQTQYCVVSCNQSTCVGRDDSKGCFNVSLWYSCMEGLFPPINSTNTWNWNSPRFALGLQRNDCLTPSLSVSATPTGTSSKRITHTRTVGLPTLTASIPFSSSRPDRSLTGSSSISFPPSSVSQSTSLSFPTPSRPYTTSLRSFCPYPSRTRSESVTEWVSETNSGLVVSESVSGSRSDEISVTGSWTTSHSRALPVVESPSFYRFNRIANGVATGLTAVAGVITGSATGRSLQRASLQRALASCGAEALVEPLDIASSPTQLRFGPADGQYLRGAVVGNLVLLSAIGLLCLLWSARWRIYRRVSWRAALALLQLPGLFTIPVTLFLQPTVTCSVWCVTSRSADVVIGVIGFLLSVLYVGWAMYTVLCGRGAVGKLRPNVHSETMSRIPPLLRTALLGVQDTTTEWCNRRPGFVESYGTLLCGYRVGRRWFAAIDLTMPFLNGMIGGIALIQPSLCGGSLTTSYFVLTVLSLFLTVIAQPYNEAQDHMFNVIALILSCVSAGVALFSDDDVAVEVLDNVQMWLSVASIGISLTMLVTSETCRAWLLCGLRWWTATPAVEKVPPLQPSPPLATTTIMDGRPPPKAAQRVTQRFPLEATAEVLEPLVVPDREAMFELTEWEELHHNHHHHHQTMVQQHIIQENADQVLAGLVALICQHRYGARTVSLADEQLADWTDERL